MLAGSSGCRNASVELSSTNWGRYETKKTVNTDINALKDLLKEESATSEQIKTATETLSTHAQKIGETIYKAAQEESQQQSGSSDEKKEDVVEAEVVDEKGEK